MVEITHQTDYIGKNVSNDVEWFLEYTLLSDKSKVQKIIYYTFLFMKKERTNICTPLHKIKKKKKKFKPETSGNDYLQDMDGRIAQRCKDGNRKKMHWGWHFTKYT